MIAIIYFKDGTIIKRQNFYSIKDYEDSVIIKCWFEQHYLTNLCLYKKSIEKIEIKENKRNDEKC